MKQLYTLIFALILSNSFAQQLAEPTVSVNSGFYLSDVNVTISHPEPGVTLFYTINGSEPLPTSQQYSAPFDLTTRIGDENNFSMIPTNPSFSYPIGDYTESRANNRGWLEPEGEVFKINILKVKAYKAGFVPSETVTKTVIVDSQGPAIYSMPILSFVVDSLDLFSAATGIYHYGNSANYTQKGAAWERIANLEYFDENGNLVVQQKVRTRIHGGGSRHSAKKSFRVYAEYEDINNFSYPFFDNYQLDKFKRILIKSGGHRPDCFPRDDLAQLITEDLNGDQQHHKHVIFFLNGEYWGIHSIKERVDPYFFQNQYGIDDNDLTILDQEYDRQGGGSSADSLEMVKIETFADTSDMTLPENFEWMADRMDMDNYIDYMAAEIFLSNEDWVYSNVVLWRKTGGYNPGAGPGHDGKFRWCFYDLDGAFGGSCSNAYYTVNTLNAATIETGPFSPYSRLFRGLLGSPIFKEMWINRICDLMNSHFKANTLHAKMDQIYNELTPEMLENVSRWRYPSEADNLADRALETPTLVQWDTSFYHLHRFAGRRQEKVKEDIMDKWGYPDTSFVTIDVNDQSMGSVQINTILINENLPGVEGTIYPWVGSYIDSVTSTLIAVPMPGFEFVEWLESGITEDTVKWIPHNDTTITAVFQATSSFQNVVINEVMPSNSNYMADYFGDYDDWLELYNPNDFAVNLSNWKIKRDTIEWTIPGGTIIPANGYRLLWHDNELYQGADHVNFKLPNSTQTVYLYSPTGTLVDFLIYPETTTDYSFGRYPNGSSTFSTFTYPTPRDNNDISTIDESTSNELVVYPNPTQGELIINISTNFQLFGLDGKLVKSGFANHKIDLSRIENGTYILVTEEGFTSKVIIQK
ncbi:MAG: CotH kinase family protein [Crocinitomicaceae bacterium]